jgi:ABC-type dipeptide/oligopeptide/nickel transport system permease component
MRGIPLLQFFVRRLLAVVITLLIITAIIFGIVLMAPVESRAQLYLGKRLRANLPEEILERHIQYIIEEHRLNDPYPVQYFHWISELLRGNWGWSPVLRADVLDVLVKRTPATMELTLYSLLLFIPLGVLTGAAAGWNRNRPFDHSFRLFAFVGTSIPPFILGLVLISIFYVGLHWFMPGYLSTDVSVMVRGSEFKTYTGLLTIDGLLNGQPGVALDAARHLVLPVVTLSVFQWATLGRVTRASIIEEAHKGYVTAAEARGLKEGRILWGHAVPNVLVPSLTTSALGAAALITGVYVVEAVFGWPGVSRLITNSMWFPDVAMASGFAVYSVLAVLAVMILLDIVQVIADPRLRKGGETS